jgi:hypothetical protein
MGLLQPELKTWDASRNKFYSLQGPWVNPTTFSLLQAVQGLLNVLTEPSEKWPHTGLYSIVHMLRLGSLQAIVFSDGLGCFCSAPTHPEIKQIIMNADRDSASLILNCVFMIFSCS